MKSKIKILVCGILPPPFFGHSAMYKILMESTFVTACDITFLNMRFWSYDRHKKITFLKLLKLIKYFLQYLYLILRERPQYILYNMSFDKMPFLKDFLFCFVGRILGVRIVIHDMGQYVGELYDQSNGLYRSLIRWVLKHATASIVLGERTKLAYKGLMDENKLFAVPGSVVDTACLELDNSASKDRTNKEFINVLYFSFMSASKGVFTAFKAVPRVLKTEQNIRFTFAGPMESKLIEQTLNQLKEDYGPKIEYRGYIADEIKRTELYRGADIFIFPTHRDVFGLVLLHAMAEGLPIIASLEGTIPEIIQDGVNGFLIAKGDDVQLAERILHLAADQRLRKKMGELNRQRYVEVYSPQRYGQRMIDTFIEIDKSDPLRHRRKES